MPRKIFDFESSAVEPGGPCAPACIGRSSKLFLPRSLTPQPFSWTQRKTDLSGAVVPGCLIRRRLSFDLESTTCMLELERLRLQSCRRVHSVSPPESSSAFRQGILPLDQLDNRVCELISGRRDGPLGPAAPRTSGRTAYIAVCGSNCSKDSSKFIQGTLPRAGWPCVSGAAWPAVRTHTAYAGAR